MMSTDTTATAVSQNLPTPGLWELDPAHSSVNFSARHLGLSRVRGRFQEFSGTVEVSDPPTQSRVDVTIVTASVTTGAQQRDEHLRSPDFFESERFPELTFRSTDVDDLGDGWQLRGDLTIRDITRPVTLDMEFEGTAPDPMSGGNRAAFFASTEVNREDWGLTWSAPLETGQILVGKKVRIELEVVMTSKPMESPAEVQADAASPESGLA